ncbi:MAG: hypothetical protein ACOCUT_02300 [bacterium]
MAKKKSAKSASSTDISDTIDSDVDASLEKVDYELVPEKKFQILAKKVDQMIKNPLLETQSAAKMETLLEEVNDSIISLLDVMKVLSDDVSFDEKEKHLIKHEVKPLTKSIDEVKDQNETIANAMVNIIDRINDLQKQITRIEKFVNPPASPIQNNNLPPLSGGPQPPNGNNSNMQTNPNGSNSGQNSSISSPSNLPPPPR